MTDDNRPLSEKDLDYLATKADLLKLQKAVVKSLKSIKREVEDLWTRINLKSTMPRPNWLTMQSTELTESRGLFVAWRSE
jgi:hypothetical protein